MVYDAASLITKGVSAGISVDGDPVQIEYLSDIQCHEIGIEHNIFEICSVKNLLLYQGEIIIRAQFDIKIFDPLIQIHNMLTSFNLIHRVYFVGQHSINYNTVFDLSLKIVRQQQIFCNYGDLLFIKEISQLFDTATINLLDLWEHNSNSLESVVYDINSQQGLNVEIDFRSDFQTKLFKRSIFIRKLK